MKFTSAVVTIMFCGVMQGHAAGTDDNWTTSPESFICRSSTEVREIKTYIGIATPDAPAPVGCRVDYIRNGATRTIWSSATTQAYCNDKAVALAATLEASHFSCKALHGVGAGKE